MAYTTEVILPRPKNSKQMLSVEVQANGGTLTVSTEFNGGWLLYEIVSADSVNIYEYGRTGSQMKLTPAGGAAFEFKVT